MFWRSSCVISTLICKLDSSNDDWDQPEADVLLLLLLCSLVVTAGGQFRMLVAKCVFQEGHFSEHCPENQGWACRSEYFALGRLLIQWQFKRKSNSSLHHHYGAECHRQPEPTCLAFCPLLPFLSHSNKTFLDAWIPCSFPWGSVYHIYLYTVR